MGAGFPFYFSQNKREKKTMTKKSNHVSNYSINCTHQNDFSFKTDDKGKEAKRKR